jgi:hypothetical protein
MKTLIKKLLREMGIELKRYNPNIRERKFISLKTENKYKGNVLLSFTVNPFLSKDGETLSTSHIADFECFSIANICLDLGYSVDVIKYNDIEFFPQRDYSIFIDVLFNLERIAPLLDNKCIRILYPYWAHWLFHNSANYQRYLALQQRRGITLKPKKLLKPNLGVKYADYIISRSSSKFAISTYLFAQKPIYHVTTPTVTLYPWSEDKNYETFRKNFLWLSGDDLVHKGLDLVLDAFVQMPDYNLYICNLIQQEKDFEKAFYKELYETPNIHVMGWIDITSHKFINIKNRCLSFIHPSCSEISVGSVLNCLQAGLIPIISYESDVDVKDFGVVLRNSSVDEIKNAIEMVSSFPAEELKNMSHQAWEFARANHMKERFIEEYKRAVLQILKNKGNELDEDGRIN